MEARAESYQRMQRVRIGLTGLAFVFVLVLLATILVRPSAEAPLTTNLVEQQKAGARPTANAAGQAEPKEPLAELGVAPGNAETNNSAAAAQPGAARQQP
ncbi:MAG TPA: hypothetical protein VF702_04590 [Allosphingosinicella sp.]|jgi:hypothetical protein